VAQDGRRPISTRHLPWPFKVFEWIDRLHAYCMRFVPEDQWDGLEQLNPYVGICRKPLFTDGDPSYNRPIGQRFREGSGAGG
jgi:hypothetical protein